MPIQLPGLIPVDRSNIELAILTLVKAFNDYPDLKYFFPEEPERQRMASYLFSMELRYAVRYYEVYATPDFKGTAIWAPPDKYPPSTWKTLLAVPLPVILGVGAYGGARLRHWGQYLDSVHRRLAPFRHWYLETIGVDPSIKGQGYASKLIRPMLSRIDQEGLPCYLETDSENNVRLYEHFGFKLLEQSPVPGTLLINFAMLRKI
jgi:ribosomal protein S18 acetylase RimI-like enzyme